MSYKQKLFGNKGPLSEGPGLLFSGLVLPVLDMLLVTDGLSVPFDLDPVGMLLKGLMRTLSLPENFGGPERFMTEIRNS